MRLTAALALVFVGCVGDDPAISTPPPADAGPITPTPPVPGPPDSGTPTPEAGTPTCAGQPFGAPQPITVSGVGATTDQVSTIRVVGTTAYFAKQSGTEIKLFRGTFAPPSGASPATLTGAQLLVKTGAGEEDQSPTVPPDGSFLVFTHNKPRKIWSAVASPSLEFMNPANASSDFISFNGDDADPWIAGNPPRALYWARAAAGNGIRRINRASLKPQSGVVPELTNLVPVSSPCPEGLDCGAPVVTDDERMMLFAVSPTLSFDPSIEEVSLTPSAAGDAVTSGTTVVKHPELGKRRPSWISADGCDVIVSLFVSSDLAYARRSAK